MKTKPCDLCRFPTSGNTAISPFVCSTCVKVLTGEWTAQPGQPSRIELEQRLEAVSQETP